MKHQQQTALTQQSTSSTAGSQSLWHNRQSTTTKQKAVDHYETAGSQPLFISSQSTIMKQQPVNHYETASSRLLYCAISALLPSPYFTVRQKCWNVWIVLHRNNTYCWRLCSSVSWDPVQPLGGGGRGSKCVLSPGRTTWVPSRGQYGPSHLSSRVNPAPACCTPFLHHLPPRPLRNFPSPPPPPLLLPSN